MESPVGLEEVAVPGFDVVPLFWVKFDKDGTCTTPVTAEQAAAAVPGRTDVFLMSHGWNNSWDNVVDRYHDWIAHLLRARQQESTTAPFDPLFIGVFWPSLLAPGDEGRGPAFAGAPGAPPAEVTELIEALSDTLPVAELDRLRALLTEPELDHPEAAAAAALLVPLFGAPDQDQPGSPTADGPADILAEWRAAAAAGTPAPPPALLPDDPVDTGLGAGPPTTGATTRPHTEPATAGILSFVPVWIARLGSVLVMKDRAGRVGARGVSNLLDSVLGAARDQTQIHLLGHSFGCKVLLAALRHAPNPRPVDSIVLLQPAISGRCFAADASGGQPGGYRGVLDRCRSAIITTFSSRDLPLTKFFHLAARRTDDLIEIDHAGGGPTYGALGGFGPQRSDEVVTPTGPLAPPHRYPDPGPGRIVAVDAGSIIGGHGQVATPATAWMLASRLRT